MVTENIQFLARQGTHSRTATPWSLRHDDGDNDDNDDNDADVLAVGALLILTDLVVPCCPSPQDTAKPCDARTRRTYRKAKRAAGRPSRAATRPLQRDNRQLRPPTTPVARLRRHRERQPPEKFLRGLWRRR
jgi:hypothetical protein